MQYLGQIYDNQWITPNRKGFEQECCKCGLKHIIKFRLRKTPVGNQIQIKFNQI
jgi:hypothetical protein